MSYTKATQINEWFLKGGYEIYQKAFKDRNAILDSPSKDGFLRRISLCNGKEYFFTADALPLNSAAARSIAVDKLATYQLLEIHGIRIPKGFAFFADRIYDQSSLIDSSLLVSNLAEAVRQTFPQFDHANCALILKPGQSRQSFKIKKCLNQNEIESHAKEILSIGHYGLVQEYIEEPEYRVVILDDKILFVYQKQPRELGEDGRRKINPSPLLPTLVPLVNVPDAVKMISLKSHRSLGLRYSGIDVCLPKQTSEAVILEVNSNPGLDFLVQCHKALADEVIAKIADAVLIAF